MPGKFGQNTRNGRTETILSRGGWIPFIEGLKSKQIVEEDDG
jgi:hypothetical protein